MADFQRRLFSGTFGGSLSGSFAQNYSNVNTGSIFTFFTEFQFLTQIAYFAKAIAHGNAIALEHGRFSALSHFWNIWCFFKRFFAHNLSNVNTDSLLTCFK